MKDILIGLIIGVGKIIPGVSGSVLAITLGVYEKIIYSINNIFKDYKNLYYLSKLGIGIIVSIVFLSRIIIYLLSNYYTYTIFIFIGLICGSMKEITTNTKLKYSYLTVLSFIIIIILGMSNISNTNHDGIFYYLLSGFIESILSHFNFIIASGFDIFTFPIKLFFSPVNEVIFSLHEIYNIGVSCFPVC